MEFISFNINELENLETLLQLSKQISDIYDSLCILEINNQKDSKEFNDLLTQLKELIKKENEELNKKNFTHQECLKYLKLLESQTQIPQMNNRITTTLKHYDKRVIRRIMLNLFEILDKSDDFHKMIINCSEMKPITSMISGITQNKLLNSMNHSAQVQSELRNDIHSIFLSILEESIEAKNNKDYRTELIISKYCVLFTHKNMEKLFINSNFDIPSIVYASSKMINELLKEAELAYNHIKHMILKSEAQKDINTLLNLHDSEYEDHNVYYSSLICQCHIRALLSLMTGDDVNDFNQEFHDIVDGPKYLSKHQNDRISESIIISCFKCFKHDREKVRILSTKNNK